MGLFDRLKGLKADYEAKAAKTLGDRQARREEEGALKSAERHLVKDYSLERTRQPGRYIVGGDKVIDINVRSYESMNKAREVLDKRDQTPTLRNLTSKQVKEYRGESLFGKISDIGQNITTNFNANAGDFFGGAGGGIGNYDFMGGGFGSDYDFMGGTSKPRKRKKSSKRKTRR